MSPFRKMLHTNYFKASNFFILKSFVTSIHHSYIAINERKQCILSTPLVHFLVAFTYWYRKEGYSNQWILLTKEKNAYWRDLLTDWSLFQLDISSSVFSHETLNGTTNVCVLVSYMSPRSPFYFQSRWIRFQCRIAVLVGRNFCYLLNR